MYQPNKRVLIDTANHTNEESQNYKSTQLKNYWNVFIKYSLYTLRIPSMKLFPKVIRTVKFRLHFFYWLLFPTCETQLDIYFQHQPLIHGYNILSQIKQILRNSHNVWLARWVFTLSIRKGDIFRGSGRRF